MMNEPRRLRDTSDSAVEHALLSAGTAYRSSDHARTRTLAALGLASTAAFSAGAAGAVSSSLFAKLGWSKLVLGAALLGAAAAPVGYYAWQRSHAQPQESVAIAVAAPAKVALFAGEVRAAAPPAASPMTPTADTSAPPAAPRPANTRQAPSEARPSAQALTAELAALDGARRALAHGDASGALTRLDAYGRGFPRGRLQLEAEVLRIDALAHAGQGDGARQRAQAFLRRHPNSVLAARVRGYLNG